MYNHEVTRGLASRCVLRKKKDGSEPISEKKCDVNNRKSGACNIRGTRFPSGKCQKEWLRGTLALQDAHEDIVYVNKSCSE